MVSTRTWRKPENFALASAAAPPCVAHVLLLRPARPRSQSSARTEGVAFGRTSATRAPVPIVKNHSSGRDPRGRPPAW